MNTEDFLQLALTYEKNVLEGEHYQAEHKSYPVFFLLTISYKSHHVLLVRAIS